MAMQKKFVFWGRDANGGYESGELSAESLKIAKLLIDERNIIVEFISERPESCFNRAITAMRIPLSKSKHELTRFTQQLSILLRAGIQLGNALDLLSQQNRKSAMAPILETILREIRSGHYLHEAMAQYPRIFDAALLNLVRAGELSGNLPGVLDAYYVAANRSQKNRRRTISALIYPLTVLFSSIFAIFFLTAKIVPRFQMLIQNEHQSAQLPLLTSMLVKLFSGIRDNSFFIAAIIFVFAILVIILSSTANGRQRISAIALSIPLVGNLILRQQLVLFLRTFSLSLSNSVPFTEALQLACGTVSNIALRKQLLAITNRVKDGISLGELLSWSTKIPPTVYGLIAVGERSACLSSMSSLAADSLDMELEIEIERISAIMRPVITIILAGLVAVVAAALFLPLTKALQINAV
jgi:type II secretory pathway component PulF